MSRKKFRKYEGLTALRRAERRVRETRERRRMIRIGIREARMGGDVVGVREGLKALRDIEAARDYWAGILREILVKRARRSIRAEARRASGTRGV